MNKVEIYQGAIKFMPNWYMLFKSRDTDKKKLDFLRTILEYAFEDRIPTVAYRDPSQFTSGEEYAIYDAFWMAKPIIDNYKRENQLGVYGGQGGRPRRGTSENQGDKPGGFFADEDSGNQGSAPPSFNKIENIKENKKENIIAGEVTPARTRKSVLDEFFERFWKEYPSTCPRKYYKKKCRDKWAIIFRDAAEANTLFGMILEGLAKWRVSRMWNDAGGQYIMAPMRWLNGRCWEDAPTEAVSTDASGGGNNPAFDELARREAEELRQMREKLTSRREGVQ